ncbi:OsmC family protein [Cupriavidus pinatubonensis]|uniref:OsmC family protein n=1 Tax=Cupriavidus pinatubonensis TaxID=248026 RepID=UPI00112973A6|nr:OsmC family protein [Cupriavidus pinatubonensis]QYY29695.1 OsmC family protein [Cupriavidus pinatubonensis]TPQ41454.1 osmotically inducible protein C [Cupriavidus pinatubonensis]
MTIQATWQPSQDNTLCNLTNGQARWQADLDDTAGGDPQYPSPHDLLDSALAACTVLTLQLYAKRKGYAVDGIHASVSHEETSGHYAMKREVRVTGNLEPKVLEDLLRVANKCPVHKSLSAEIAIDTTISG